MLFADVAGLLPALRTGCDEEAVRPRALTRPAFRTRTDPPPEACVSEREGEQEGGRRVRIMVVVR